MKKENEWLTPAEAARLMGCHAQSLRRWEREGKIKAHRTPGNQRRFRKEDVERLSGFTVEPVRLFTVCYGRVSTSSQRDDLERQIDYLSQRYPEAEIVAEIGSGLNFKRGKFIAVLKRIMSGDIQRLVVAHPDRLCRFGFDLVEWLCKEFGCELVVLNERKLSPEQELITDMLSIVDCFSSRLYGLRKYQKQISEELRQEQLQEIPESSPEQECQDISISL
jgi:excisionase family DNA binding protein